MALARLWKKRMVNCVDLFLCFLPVLFAQLPNTQIYITPETLQLTFGIFTWKIAVTNIESCYLDKTSLWRIGGAGIHFTWIKGKYRAFWNFLEYPRVAVMLKRKKGAVREIAFSTRHPGQVTEHIQSRIN
jgi:hypothetical protein